MSKDLESKKSIDFISVIIPVFNAEKYLPATLESVFAQTFRKFEVIAVNDGSTDGSYAVLQEYALKHPNLKIFNRTNHGVALTANFAIEQASSKWIARIDADDLMAPDRLLIQTKFLEKHPKIGLIGTWAKIIDEDGRPTKRHHHHPSHDYELRYQLQFHNYFVQSAVLFKKEIWLKAGKYIEHSRRPDDFDLWSRMLRFTDIANIPEELTYYRETQGSVSRRDPVEYERYLSEIGVENIAFLQNKASHKSALYFKYYEIGKGRPVKIEKSDFLPLILIHLRACMNSAKKNPLALIPVWRVGLKEFYGILVCRFKSH